MKRVFLGVVTTLIVAWSVAAGPFYDPVNDGSTTFGAGITYSSNSGIIPFTTEIYAQDGNCLQVTFSGLSNDVDTQLICNGEVATSAGGELQIASVDGNGFCMLVVTITDAAPVSDDFDVIVARTTGMCP